MSRRKGGDNNIAALRRALGISQGQFCKDIGVCKDTMRSYEHGCVIPSDVLVRMADRLGASTDFLLGRAGYTWVGIVEDKKDGE